MPHTVFFSWQIDTESRGGRNFIESALKRAAARIGRDTEIEDAIRDLAIDRDTMNVPGTPPIVDTIFKKIDSAAIFVPDLTFVGEAVGRAPDAKSERARCVRFGAEISRPWTDCAGDEHRIWRTDR